MKIKFLILFAILVLVATACEFGSPAATATPTVNAAATEQARNAIATQAAEQTLAAEETAAMQLTETALAGKTATAIMQMTERANAKLTAAANETATALEATAMADPMFQFVEQLLGEGYITSSSGTYLPLEDWERAEAMLHYFNREPTFILANNFVYRANWAWESASTTADWWSSGCGITFREGIGDGNYYLIYLGLDGYVYFYRADNGNLQNITRAYAQKMDVPIGQVDVALAVEGSMIYFFVNGQRILTRQDTRHTEGFLGFSIVSGTNASFGTRCTMTEIELWLLG